MLHWSGSMSRRRVLTASLTAACAAVPIAAPAAATRRSPAVPGGKDAYVRSVLERMTLEQKVGQLFVTHVYGGHPTDVSAEHAAKNRAAYGVATPAEVVEKYRLGGVIYFSWSGNVDDPTQVAKLSNGLQTTAADAGAPPLLIAADQETGIVARMPAPATEFPGAQALAAGGSTRDARRAAMITARELRAVGISQNFAPVADVNVNPENPVIGVRSFSSDPGMAARYVHAQVTGYQRGSGVASAAKHFPGHGDTTEDSHVDLPRIDHTRAQWEKLDRPPFQAAIAADVDVIMTAHIVVPSLDPSEDPATLSRPIITGLLREEMGYDGVIVTDALNMDAIVENWGSDQAGVLALKAGVDQLLVPEDGHMDTMVGSVLDAVRSGEIDEARLDRSVTRLLELKWRRGIVADAQVEIPAVSRRVGNRAHVAAAQRITDPTITALRNDGPDGAPVLPVGASGGSVQLASASWSAGHALADSLRRRGMRVDLLVTGTRPSDTEIADTVGAAAGHDLTVVVTSRAWDTERTDPQGRQRRLVAEVTGTGNPVAAVAARDAYDVAYLPEQAAFLAAYSTTTVSMESVAKVITGETAPAGHLPVDVPAADGSPLYPIGTGLTWPVATQS
ncbi:beta-N-acetylhexosaminidase [Haloactinopolyspora alba]|uniref:beta-N-acetylhexosaminidase n=1 Tax=Haloactinopolyspora alba TaxID=648780 RepID=A0A2P8DJY6_9ACTN|nr:glycoside hydrolase family 3 protein [Haloactinopolyspora alba]PSK97533.1 beta-N-acetylhexosaminidase [Haloactinopolyspora alba]